MANEQKTDHDMLVELHTAICGYNGQEGLLKNYAKFKENYYKEKNDHNCDYQKFKRCVYMLVSFAVGSGLLGGGIGLSKLLGG